MKHLGKENKNFTEPSVKILDKVENKERKAFLLDSLNQNLQAFALLPRNQILLT